MEDVKNNLLNAEVAYSNQKYREALAWYQKALADTPDDIYVLSRTGAICVSLGKFDDALRYFEHAKELDPNNGDNVFNYANACFFKKDYVAAFNGYVEAEKIGCSEDVTPRLYYQLALICSMRQDIKSSLVYFGKCEEIDRTGVISLSPDLISEKLKLYLATQDNANAEKCAAQLVAIQPTLFRNYMVYFSILMAHKNFAVAERVLEDAKKYADTTDNDKFTILLQLAALYASEGENDPAQKAEKLDQAIQILEEQHSNHSLTVEQITNLLLTLAEIYLKAEQYDKAIWCLSSILTPHNEATNSEATIPGEVHELSPEEIEEMIQEDMLRIQSKIDTGEIDGNLGMYATIEYDEEGNERRVYDGAALSAITEERRTTDETGSSLATENSEFEVTSAIREKIHFTLLSAFLGKEDFVSAAKFADILKHSDNKYYSYYGLYVSALADRKINGKTDSTDRKYAEAIAFFRNKTFSDPTDTLAAIFRARLYAEQGKSEKAKEIADLLADTDRQAVLEYVKQCEKN